MQIRQYFTGGCFLHHCLWYWCLHHLHKLLPTCALSRVTRKRLTVNYFLMIQLCEHCKIHLCLWYPNTWIQIKTPIWMARDKNQQFLSDTYFPCTRLTCLVADRDRRASFVNIMSAETLRMHKSGAPQELTWLALCLFDDLELLDISRSLLFLSVCTLQYHPDFPYCTFPIFVFPYRVRIESVFKCSEALWNEFGPQKIAWHIFKSSSLLW